MMCRRPSIPVLSGAALVLTVSALTGCGVLNPSLVGTVTSSSIYGMESPQGTILIAVFNASSSIAAAHFQITKKSGGVVDLVIPVQPADNNPADESDRGIAIQDCDVQSITLVEVLASVSGGVQQFGTGLPSLDDGVRLSCGKTVVVTITGSAPNLLVALDVF